MKDYFTFFCKNRQRYENELTPNPLVKLVHNFSQMKTSIRYLDMNHLMNVLQNAAAEFCTSLNENSRLVEVKDVLNFLFLNLNSGQQLTEIEMKIQVYNEKQQARLEVISFFYDKTC